MRPFGLIEERAYGGGGDDVLCIGRGDAFFLEGMAGSASGSDQDSAGWSSRAHFRRHCRGWGFIPACFNEAPSIVAVIANREVVEAGKGVPDGNVIRWVRHCSAGVHQIGSGEA